MKLRVLLFLLLLAAPPSLSAGPSAPLHRPLRIAAVADGPWERNQEFYFLLKGILNEVLGGQTPVTFYGNAMLEADWTLPGVRRINDRLLADTSVDMILGMGVLTSHDLATRGPLPKPVIAPLVLDPVHQKIPLQPGGTSGVRNLSYLVFPTTFERDIRLFRGIIPFRKVAYVFSRRYEQALPFLEPAAVAIAKTLGLQIVTIAADTSADEVLKAIPADADAVYLQAIAHFSADEFARLSEGFIARRLPSFSLLGESDVRQGIMAGANPDFMPRLTRRVALHIQRITTGQDPSTLSVDFSVGKRLLFNFQTAYQVGVTPSWDMLLESDLTGFDSPSPFAERYTLAGAVKRALDANLDIQAMERDVNAVAEDVAGARSYLLPKLDFNAGGYQIDKDRAVASYQPERSGAYDLTANQLIFSEPALAGVAIRSHLLEGKQSELSLTRLNTVVAGTSSYLNLLRMRKNLFILLDNLRVTRSNMDLAESRRRAGVAGQEEPLRWQAEIAEMKKAVLQVQSQLQQTRYALNQVLHLPLQQELDAADVGLDDSTLFVSNPRIQGYLGNPIAFDLLTEYMVSRGVERSPELQQLDAAIAAQERSLSSARMSYFLPTIGAYAKYSNTFYKSAQTVPFQLTSIPLPPEGLDPRVPAYLGQLLGGIATPLPDRQDWTIGLQLSLNIFNGFGTRATEAKAGEQLEQYRLQRDASVERVALRVRSEMQNARTSFFAIQQSRVEQDVSRKVLNIVTDSYSRGAVSILNLLDAQNSALRANQVAVNAQYDFLITYFSLQRSLGQFDILMTASDREKFLNDLLKFMENSLAR